MKYYSFDRITGAYLGSADADESPAEPGAFLLPAYATWKEPVLEEGKSAYFVEDEWSLKDIGPDAVMANIVGSEGDDAAKKKVIYAWAKLTADAAAKALDFESMDDALSYISGDADSQREYDAVTLKEWRLEMMKVTDKVVNAILNEGAPFIAPEQYSAILPPLRRKHWTPPPAPEPK